MLMQWKVFHSIIKGFTDFFLEMLETHDLDTQILAFDLILNASLHAHLISELWPGFLGGKSEDTCIVEELGISKYNNRKFTTQCDLG